MGRPRKNKDSNNQVKTVLKKKCLHCGEELDCTSFYKSQSSIYSKNDNYLPVCKECIKALYEQYLTKYKNEFSIFEFEIEGDKIEKFAIERLVIKRLCMILDIYYSDSAFETALKIQEKTPKLSILSSYLKVSNLKQHRGKTYDDTICEENMTQELVKSSIVKEVQKKCECNEVYEKMYALCLELMHVLRKTMIFK